MLIQPEHSGRGQSLSSDKFLQPPSTNIALCLLFTRGYSKTARPAPSVAWGATRPLPLPPPRTKRRSVPGCASGEITIGRLSDRELWKTRKAACEIRQSNSSAEGLSLPGLACAAGQD